MKMQDFPAILQASFLSRRGMDSGTTWCRYLSMRKVSHLSVPCITRKTTKRWWATSEPFSTSRKSVNAPFTLHRRSLVFRKATTRPGSTGGSASRSSACLCKKKWRGSKTAASQWRRTIRSGITGGASRRCLAMTLAQMKRWIFCKKFSRAIERTITLGPIASGSLSGSSSGQTNFNLLTRCLRWTRVTIQSGATDTSSSTKRRLDSLNRTRRAHLGSSRVKLSWSSKIGCLRTCAMKRAGSTSEACSAALMKRRLNLRDQTLKKLTLTSCAMWFFLACSHSFNKSIRDKICCLPSVLCCNVWRTFTLQAVTQKK